MPNNRGLQKIIKILKRKKYHHSYQLKQDRTFRVVIRNLHHSINLEDAKFELNEKGFDVQNMTNIKHRTTKDPLPLFFLDLEPNADNKLSKNSQYKRSEII